MKEAYRVEGAGYDALDRKTPTEDANGRETCGLDSSICRGLANMDELTTIEALGLALVAVAKAARE